VTRFVYDGSFDGFLCAVSMALSACGQAAITPLENDSTDLFSRDVPVVSEDGPARALRARIVAAAGEEEMETLLLAQASGNPKAPELLLSYISLTLAAGAPIRDNAALPEVLDVQRIRNRVSLEIHKFLGFVRLRKVGGCVYYARIEPDSNIVGFIGPHFADRFRDQSILIHDARRNTGFWRDAGAGNLGGGSLVDLSRMPPELERALAADSWERDAAGGLSPPAPADESLVQSLWRSYFARIAIPERRNPGLQAKLMPRRYWKNLVEKNETAG
jgi:probable DNA metabolism protein